MKHLHKILSVLLLWGVSLTGISPARASETTAADTVVTFRFLPGENMFTRAVPHRSPGSGTGTALWAD